MQRLDFALHDFSRVSWVSETAKAVWSGRIASVAAAWRILEVKSVTHGLRKCCLIHVPTELLARETAQWSEDGLLGIPLTLHPTSGGYTSRSASPDMAKSLRYRVVVGRADDLLAFQAAHQQCDELRLGKLLGYPECCSHSFVSNWHQQKLIDFTWPMALATGLPNTKNDVIRVESAVVASNILLRWLGLRLAPHLPCRFGCEQTEQLGAEFVKLGTALGFAREMEWLVEALSWPVEWSALHGICEIKTPILKISANTDATACKYTVQVRGRRPGHAYVAGAKFPYETRIEPKKLRSRADEGLARNNGFRSVESMRQAHAPIVAAASELLSRAHGEKLTILDLGCGNGELLRAVCNQEPRAIPCGIEHDRSRIKQAWELMPAVANQLICGSMFSKDALRFLSRPFVLTMLMVGRLTEAPPEQIEILRRFIRENSDHLLLYAYSDSLRASGGSFAKLCERAGIVIDADKRHGGALYILSKAQL